MKKIFLLMLFLCSMSVWAQDVIVKKDGSTVVCRIVEVTKTEVIYKKWSDQQGSNYIVNQKDLTAIHHENGTKTTFDAAPAAPTETAPSANAQPMTDAELLKMAGFDTNKMARRAKRLKKAGWIAGGVMLAASIPMIALSFDGDGGVPESRVPLYCCGVVAFTGGVVTGAACLVRAKKINRTLYAVSSASLYQQEFRLNNGTTLSPSFDLLKDNTRRNTTFGIGLTYNF